MIAIVPAELIQSDGRLFLPDGRWFAKSDFHVLSADAWHITVELPDPPDCRMRVYDAPDGFPAAGPYCLRHGGLSVDLLECVWCMLYGG